MVGVVGAPARLRRGVAGECALLGSCSDVGGADAKSKGEITYGIRAFAQIRSSQCRDLKLVPAGTYPRAECSRF